MQRNRVDPMNYLNASSLAVALTRNQILNGLAGCELECLSPLLSRIWLPTDYIAAQQNEPFEHIYFPESAIIAVIACSSHSRHCYTGLYGYEGCGCLGVALGIPTSPGAEVVQSAGYVCRLPVAELRDLLGRLPEFRRRMHAYLHIMMMQVSYTALANGSTRIEQRLARWLLMVQDRARTSSLAITHQRLSNMLGVRRSGITEALHVLEGEKLIRGHRGLIDILDRQRLIQRTAGAYGAPEAEYLRLL